MLRFKPGCHLRKYEHIFDIPKALMMHAFKLEKSSLVQLAHKYVSNNASGNQT
jgi:hypothetical protein